MSLIQVILNGEPKSRKGARQGEKIIPDPGPAPQGVAGAHWPGHSLGVSSNPRVLGVGGLSAQGTGSWGTSRGFPIFNQNISTFMH